PTASPSPSGQSAASLNCQLAVYQVGFDTQQSGMSRIATIGQDPSQEYLWVVGGCENRSLPCMGGRSLVVG
ncbi:MAG TPA: hypothetical protein VHQ03_09975, partial [Candidatus Dormibacteraeota bacterium]|nr:hypothetical protein [Candidatus Dormibacteraeota bacterium]